MHCLEFLVHLEFRRKEVVEEEERNTREEEEGRWRTMKYTLWD